MSPSCGYERLSRLDETFLAFETPNTYMHIAVTAVFEGAGLASPEGGVDLARIRRHVAARLHRMHRFRQRLAHVPLVNDAIWIDDDRFDLGYHLRHASLPHPGDERQLRRRCAEILERPLDRRRPLWEIWIIEGLEEGRFALLAKVHHCMVDGVGGVGMLGHLFSLEPDEEPSPAEPWTPRAAPRQARLLRDELRRRRRRAATLGGDMVSGLRHPLARARSLSKDARALGSLLASGLGRSAPVAINGEVGPHRRIAWVTQEIDALQATRKRYGGTLNDLVLTAVAGALGRYLATRQRRVSSLKVAVPVNVRGAAGGGGSGNRTAAWLMPLPVQERDPLRRLQRVIAETSRCKQSHQAEAIQVLARAAEWATGSALHAGVRAVAQASPYNLIVTNVPGPPVPLYMLGSRLLAAYPQLPLFENQGLGVALLSYVGRLHFGLTADWDLVPDLEELRASLAQSLEELCKLATPLEVGRPQA